MKGRNQGIRSTLGQRHWPQPALSLPQFQQAQTVIAPDSELIHLLNRTTYGYSEQELALAEQLGVEGWLDYQLNPEQIDTSELEATLAESFPSLAWSYGEIFDDVQARQEAGNQGDQELPVPIQLILATLLRQWFSGRQLYELMVEFWTNHFNVFLFDGVVQYLKTGDDRDHIRPHALGKFRDLLQANARSPAMLIYLDNYSNTVDGPNENYARELLELHTLGVDGGYTEGDVKQVAKAFTGWTLSEREEDLFQFVPALHDDGERQVLGETISAGQGIGAGETVLDMLAEHPSTANFIAFKLGQRFVADQPPQSLIDQVAQTYLATDGDIKAMLRTLFLSTEFRAAAGGKFKRPLEYAVSLLRRLEPNVAGRFYQAFFEQLDVLGQVPFFAGPPTGYDDTEADWLNTSALLQRWNIAAAVAFGSLERARQTGDRNEQDVLDIGVAIDLERLLGGAQSTTEIVDQLIERVLHSEIDAADRQWLINECARGTPVDYALIPEARELIARRALAAIVGSRYFQQR